MHMLPIVLYRDRHDLLTLDVLFLTVLLCHQEHDRLPAEDSLVSHALNLIKRVMHGCVVHHNEGVAFLEPTIFGMLTPVVNLRDVQELLLVALLTSEDMRGFGCGIVLLTERSVISHVSGLAIGPHLCQGVAECFSYDAGFADVPATQDTYMVMDFCRMNIQLGANGSQAIASRGRRVFFVDDQTPSRQEKGLQCQYQQVPAGSGIRTVR